MVAESVQWTAPKTPSAPEGVFCLAALMRSSRMVDNFLQNLRADRLIGPQERILVAVSGGSDSVALLHLLHAVAPALQLTLTAAHLDHAIRPKSCDDADFVRSLCTRLQIPLLSERIDVPALAQGKKIGLEEAGRVARLAFLHRVAEEHDCSLIALGHHRGDQAETLLHHLGRGCGLHGLAAMRRRRGALIRPLLNYGKADLLDYLAEIGAEFVTDESNAELDFTRNRIRHQLLPTFSSLNPRIETTLATLAESAAREDDYWQEEVARLKALLVKNADGELRLSLPEVRALHPAPRYRLLHDLLTSMAQGQGKEVGARHIMALDALLTSAAPQGEIHLPGGVAVRRYEQLSLRTQPLSLPCAWSLLIVGTGLYSLPNGDQLQVEIGVDLHEGSPLLARFDAALTPFPLTLRSVQPGDRMHLPGLNGRKRLKELLMEERVPREARRSLCLLENGAGEILWLVGMRRSLHAPVLPGQAVLRILYVPHNSLKAAQTP